MDLGQVMRIIRRWGWLVLLPVIIVGLWTAAQYRRPPTVYRVAVRLAVGSEPAAALSPDYDRYYAWLASEYIANALADLARTGEFAGRVSLRLERLGYAIPASALQAAIVTDNLQSMAFIEIVWPDVLQIVAIADAVSDELTQNAALYFPQMRDVGTVARRVDDPVPVALAPGLRAQLTGPALRLALAGGLGLGLMFLAHYIDPMVRDVSDLDALGVRSLAAIPRYRSGRRTSAR